MPAVFHPMPWGSLYVEEQGEALTRIHFLRPEDTPTVSMLQEEGLATLTPAGRLLLTRAGRLVADEIAVALM